MGSIRDAIVFFILLTQTFRAAEAKCIHKSDTNDCYTPGTTYYSKVTGYYASTSRSESSRSATKRVAYTYRYSSSPDEAGSYSLNYTTTASSNSSSFSHSNATVSMESGYKEVGDDVYVNSTKTKHVEKASEGDAHSNRTKEVEIETVSIRDPPVNMSKTDEAHSPSVVEVSHGKGSEEEVEAEVSVVHVPLSIPAPSPALESGTIEEGSPREAAPNINPVLDKGTHVDDLEANAVGSEVSEMLEESMRAIEDASLPAVQSSPFPPMEHEVVVVPLSAAPSAPLESHPKVVHSPAEPEMSFAPEIPAHFHPCGYPKPIDPNDPKEKAEQKDFRSSETPCAATKTEPPSSPVAQALNPAAPSPVVSPAAVPSPSPAAPSIIMSPPVVLSPSPAAPTIIQSPSVVPSPSPAAVPSTSPLPPPEKSLCPPEHKHVRIVTPSPASPSSRSERVYEPEESKALAREVKGFIRSGNITALAELVIKSDDIYGLNMGLRFDEEDRNEEIARTADRDSDKDVIALKALAMAALDPEAKNKVIQLMVLVATAPDGYHFTEHRGLVVRFTKIFSDDELLQKVIESSPHLMYFRRRVLCTACTPVHSYICAHCWPNQICHAYFWCGTVKATPRAPSTPKPATASGPKEADASIQKPATPSPPASKEPSTASKKTPDVQPSPSPHKKRQGSRRKRRSPKRKGRNSSHTSKKSQ